MPLISDTIPNLTGGVSQQADNLRYSNTAQACENAMLSPVTGLQKRQAAEWLGELHPHGTTSDLVLDDRAAVHWIDRDLTEHYALVFDSNGPRAFDADTGASIECIIESGVADYLFSDGAGGVATDFASALRFATVADTTFVANRNVTVLGSTDADFLPHHFSAYPQLAYDSKRGGSGIVKNSVTHFRSDATYSQTTFEFSNPKYPSNTFRHAVISGDGTTKNGLYVEHSNDNNYEYTSNFKVKMVSATASMSPGNTYIIVESGKLEHDDSSLQQNIISGLGLADGNTGAQSWETFSVGSLLTSRHVTTKLGPTQSLVSNTGTSSTPVRFSFATLASQTYGPNGAKATLFGRTISHDLAIENGYLRISDDNGASYRALRVNDNATAKLYSTAALRPWSGSDADTTADIDFANVDLTVTSNAAKDATAQAVWDSGSNFVDTPNQDLFASAFMPSSSAQLALLNDIVWVLSHFAADDTQGVFSTKYTTAAYAPPSVAPVNADGLTFTTVASGSNQAQVPTFQDLPSLSGTSAPTSGTVYQVGGTAIGDGAYHVIAYADELSTDSRYIETYREPFVLDEATMPVKVQRLFSAEGNPQFVFTKQSYAPRVAGDSETNVVPSFVGSEINDIFVHAGRLGVLSGENISLSATDFGEVSNFFRGTVTQLLDNDRVDLNASTGEVAKLNFAVPFANTLLLMSDTAQYRLVSSGALTPATSVIQQTGAYATSLHARPQRVGRSVFAAVNDTERTTVREFRADIDTEILDSNEITTQVPKYLPPNVHKLAYSAKKNLLIALSHAKTNELCIYNYYDTSTQRLQSAWSKWALDADTHIVSAEVIEDNLHLICAVTVPDYVGALEAANATGTAFGTTQERTHMLRIPLNEVTEARSSTFPVLADFRVTRSQCVTVEGYRQGSVNASSPVGSSAFNFAASPLTSTNLISIPLPDGLDFSVVELPYKTTATDVRTIFTDSTAYGISAPLLAALNFEISSTSSQTALAAATGAFLAAPSQSTADAINAIVVNTANTKVLVVGRLDGVFATPDDNVLDNITTAVTPNFVIGRAYTLSYEQSPIFYKTGEANVGKTDARLQLRYLTVTCDETSSFDVEVTASGRQMRKYDYEAFKPGVSDFTLGSRRFASESFRFPVFAQNHNVKIVLKNSTVLPSTLTSIEWQGFISPKAVPAR